MPRLNQAIAKRPAGAFYWTPGESALGIPQPYMPWSREPVSAGPICCNVGLGGEAEYLRST